MNQISIGDTSNWIILDGDSIVSPFKKCTAFFNLTSDSFTSEHLEITLSGTPAQISAAISTLQKVGLRSNSYALGEYSQPQLIRFKPTTAANYYYAQITNIYLDSNPGSYITHQRGSFIVNLHYTRPNYFDGGQVELPLTGRPGNDITGGFALVNHTDVDPTDGNTALIKSTDAAGDLPGPLRVDLYNNYATGVIKDIFFGIYHHPTVTSEDIFFYNAATLMSGGTLYMNVGAIGSWYRSITWVSAAWTHLFTVTVAAATSRDLDGRTFRPILHLFNSHAYTDLYLRLYIRAGGYNIQICDFVWSDPTYDYVVFPPIQIPPKQILRENNPIALDIRLYALRESGASSTLDIDQFCLFPMDYAATFLSFFRMGNTDRLIYDNFRELTNVRDGASQLETIAHNVQGGPLLLYPNENSRFFVWISNNFNTFDIDRTSVLRLYYRPRVRLL